MKITRVVNLRTEPLWDVYIGRAGRGQSGYFGNPIRAGQRCSVCGNEHAIGATTLRCFERYFYARLESDPEFKLCVEQLRGKTLACFCKPRACHGDIIVEYLEGL